MSNEAQTAIAEALSTEIEAEAVATEEVQPTEVESEPTEATENDDGSFPKKAVNALMKRDTKIGRLTAKNHALEAELQALRNSISQPKTTQDDDFDFDRFDNLGEALKELARIEAAKQLAEGSKKLEDNQKQIKQEQWLEERETAVAEKAAEYIQSVPDYQAVMLENADIVDDFPEEIQKVLLEADDAALAFYALAKEGKLEALATMTPVQAAMAIAKAEERGAVLAKTRPISKAPNPITANRGTGAGVEIDPTKMSYQQLLKSL